MQRSVSCGGWLLATWVGVVACGTTSSVPPSSRPDGGPLSDASPDAGMLVHEVIDAPGLPRIDNFSGASRERVVTLTRQALTGLGFPPQSTEGPRPEDRVFVGRYYLAWIDQTGFVGKMNGLWVLDHAPGDALDFVTRDPDGRPVNFFIPGENGDGEWALGYRGAEHLEFPSNLPEPNDSPSCAQGLCNWYSLDEAPPIRRSGIPWWTACNAGSASFDTVHTPLQEASIQGGLKWVYEAPLVKQADGDGTYDGDDCHAPPLFSDGVRRPVYLQAGYELLGDAPFFDRTLQVRNPEGNPPFDGPMSFIGGFVFTQWPNPHYLKRLHRYWRPETRAATLTWGSSKRTLFTGTWNFLGDWVPPSTDVVLAWIDQPLTLSGSADYVAGQSATLSHVGPSDNRDVGACLCTIHGGLEMGGGLLHHGISLPLEGGTLSVEARRRLSVAGIPPPKPQQRIYEAETALSHETGHAEADGWAAHTSTDAPGHLAFGPYATDFGEGAGQAEFRLLVDDVTSNDDTVVRLDVYDTTTDTVLAERSLTRRAFHSAFTYQGFTLNFDLSQRSGHKLETRVWWWDKALVRLDKVVVRTVAP